MKFLSVLLFAGTTLSSAAEIGVVEEIIAKVNGDIITRGDLERSRRQMEAELRAEKLVGPRLQDALREREKDILRDRIDQLLLVFRAKELNINVDAELSKYIAELQVQNKIADTEKFQQFIHEQAGIPFEDFRAETKNGMLTQRVIGQEVGQKINIKKEEIQKYYAEHKAEFIRDERIFLRELLVSTDGKDAAGVAAATKKAKDLVARARKGEKFPELARDNSDAVSAKQGGDIGGWKKGDLLKAIEDAVWSQPRGYVSDPIRVDNGFLIVKVDEHQQSGQATAEEAENAIKERLYMPRMQPAVRAYLTKLRQDSFIEIRSGIVDTGAAPGKSTAWSDPAQLKPETVTKAEVSNRSRKKRLLWLVPIPGTEGQVKTKSSSSK